MPHKIMALILIISFSVTFKKKELKAVSKLVESQDYNTVEQCCHESVVEGSEINIRHYQLLAGKIYV